MPLNLFGFQISKRLDRQKEKSTEEPPVLKSVVPAGDEDGSQTISAGGYFGQYVDIDGTAVASDQDLIVKYRAAAMEAECDHAINCIVDEAIVSADDLKPVTLRLDDLDYAEDVKKEIFAEFEHIVRLLDFNHRATEIFRQWYVDGRAYYHVLIDEKNPKKGIQELRFIDPIRMRKVREIETTIDSKSGVNLVETKAEYYVYNDSIVFGQGLTTVASGESVAGVKIDPGAVVYAPSGILDSSRKRVISYLHKVLKPVNQLRMMEDSLVIYRISRAPERRIFYVDVGNLPKGKAEEYMQGLISKYRNKLVYDASTGAIRDDRRHMSMLEDFWLPRREGGRGTEITTLPGGENLGQIDDILYFKKGLYKCMNVPLSRFDNESTFSLGRATEVSREEVSFQKFVNRLRKKFAYIFIQALRTQLILKEIITDEDWHEIKEFIQIDFQRDNYFAELKDSEILRERIGVLDAMGDKIGKYFSQKWVRRHVLHQSDEEIETMNQEIQEELDGTAPAPGDEAPDDGTILPSADDGETGDDSGQEPADDGETPESSGQEDASQETKPDQADGDSDGEGEEYSDFTLDGIGIGKIKELISKYGLDSESKVSEGGREYIRVTDPKSGVTGLFDPSITTESGFLKRMSIGQDT